MDELLKAAESIDPLWLVVLVGVVIVVLLGVKLKPVPFGRLLAGFVQVAILAAIGAGGYYGYHYLEDARRLAERRTLDERAGALFSQTVQPGSAFACIDGSPAPAMLEACERHLFADPQRVAAAVAIVAQRLAFLADALHFAETRDPSYLGRVETLRNAVETDPYGFVAYVLSTEHRCTAEACERFRLLRDPTRVKENIRSRRFEAFMVKHAPDWRDMSAASAEPGRPDLPGAAEQPVVPSVSISERPGVNEIVDPAAAASPNPPAGSGDLTPATAAAPVLLPRPRELPPDAQPQADTPANPVRPSAPSPKDAPPRADAKAKANPAVRRTPEPVPGLPRVVPSDYVRDRDQAGEATAQASGDPGAPTPLAAPQQNFIGR